MMLHKATIVLVFFCAQASFADTASDPLLHDSVRGLKKKKKKSESSDKTSDSSSRSSGSNRKKKKRCKPDNTFFEEFDWEKAKRHKEYDYSGKLKFCGEVTNDGISHPLEMGVEIQTPPDKFQYLPSDSKAACGENLSKTPLFRMKAGKKYRLILENESNFSTNIHSHGLHISGNNYGDDVTRVAKPGTCLRFDWYIEDDHMPGTHWYHSHKHHLTRAHVTGGAFGPLIIDEDKNKLRRYPHSIRAWLKNEVILQMVYIRDSKDESGALDKRMVNGIEKDSSKGAVKVKVVPGEWYYFRVLVATINDEHNNIVFVGGCETHIAAYDGVWRTKVPREDSTPPTTIFEGAEDLGPLPYYDLTGSSRVDFAVKCDADASIYMLQGTTNSDESIPFVPTNDQKFGDETRMVDIKVLNECEGRTTHASPYVDGVQWEPHRPSYLRDLRGPAPDNTFDIVSQIDESLSGYNWDKLQMEGRNPMTTDFAEYKNYPPLKFGDLQEWNVVDSNWHPYHTHVNHVQVAEEGGCGYMFEEGEYYDTIRSDLILGSDGVEFSGCLVRAKFETFSGRIIAHCHNLQHEDRGMMTWFNMIGGPENYTYPPIDGTVGQCKV